MKRVHFEQWVIAKACPSHHEGKELVEWCQDMTDAELALLQAQGPMLRDIAGRIHIAKVENIGEGETE